MANPLIGNKPGLAAKWFQGAWDAPTHVDRTPLPEGRLEAILRYARGEPLPREAFPEAAHVFDRKRFERLGDLSAVGGFYIVKGKLAQVLAQCKLCRGGLIPLPIYQEDRVTPMDSEWFIWDFGEQKSALLPEQSRQIRPDGIGLNVVKNRWVVWPDLADDDVALLKEAASAPPDVWCDPRLRGSLFFSGALVEALGVAKIKIDFSLRRCRLI
jgi:hypothetical protein